MPYNWPLANQTKPHEVFGTFGEFRGAAGDGLSRLHGAHDIATGNTGASVYSIDTGLLVRETPAVSGNPSAGGGGIRVGHFGYMHVVTVDATPGNGSLPIYVVGANDLVYAAKQGIAKPSHDADFASRAAKDVPHPTQPFDAYRKKGANDYEAVTFWPQARPIGTGVAPTDLHLIYYESAAGPYADAAALHNPLEVLIYDNTVKPKARKLLMTGQADESVEILFLEKGQTGVVTPAHGGVNFKVHAYSPFRWYCGVYQLDYRIFCVGERPHGDPGSGHAANAHDTGRLVTWQFARLPSDADSFLIVDCDRSTFKRPVLLANYAADDKRTVYTLTHAKGMSDVRQTNHWEVEDTQKWPDCEYEIDVWAMNIKHANGPGVPPTLHEVKYSAQFKLKTEKNGDRTITVTKEFSDQP